MQFSSYSDKNSTSNSELVAMAKSINSIKSKIKSLDSKLDFVIELLAKNNHEDVLENVNTYVIDDTDDVKKELFMNAYNRLLTENKTENYTDKNITNKKVFDLKMKALDASDCIDGSMNSFTNSLSSYYKTFAKLTLLFNDFETTGQYSPSFLDKLVLFVKNTVEPADTYDPYEPYKSDLYLDKCYLFSQSALFFSDIHCFIESIKVFRHVFTLTVEEMPDFKETNDLLEEFLEPLGNYVDNLMNVHNSALNYVKELDELYKLEDHTQFYDLLKQFKVKFERYYIILHRVVGMELPKIRGTARKNCNVESGEAF